MRASIIFLMLLVIGCTNQVVDEPNSIGINHSEAQVLTRSNADSLTIAIANSELIMQLQNYNDSIMAQSVAPYGIFSWFKKIQNTALADLCGFAGGFFLGCGIGNPIVGACLGVVSGSSMSAAFAEKSFPDKLPHKLPSSQIAIFSSFDKYSKLVNSDINYNLMYASALNQLGDISLFSQYITYFDKGVQHNLNLMKYHSDEEYEDWDKIQSIFEEPIYSKIYNDKIMNFLSSDRESVMNNDIQWDYIISDRINQTTTISQYKTAEIIRKYIELMNVSESFEIVKQRTSFYMNTISNNNELSLIDKTCIMESLSLYICSVSYWQGKIAQD